MVNTIDAFRDYLQKEKSILHIQSMLFLNDITSFQSFNETHFAQETIEDVNYGQIRVGLWRLWMEVCLMFP
jgi:integrase/recombinase XerC